jgi:hypothetical protein
MPVDPLSTDRLLLAAAYARRAEEALRGLQRTDDPYQKEFDAAVMRATEATRRLAGVLDLQPADAPGPLPAFGDEEQLIAYAYARRLARHLEERNDHHAVPDVKAVLGDVRGLCRHLGITLPVSGPDAEATTFHERLKAEARAQPRH